jgi:hypothetical protein
VRLETKGHTSINMLFPVLTPEIHEVFLLFTDA